MLKLHPSVVASRRMRSASLLALAAAMLVPVAAAAEEAPEEKKEVEALVVYGRGATANTTATGLDLTPRVMDAGGSWSLELGNGTQVVVGRTDARPRLGRFARMLPQLLAAQAQPLVRADLRYTNGFALVWAKPGIGNGESEMALPPAIASSGAFMPGAASVRHPQASIPHSPFSIPGFAT